MELDTFSGVVVNIYNTNYSYDTYTILERNFIIISRSTPSLREELVLNSIERTDRYCKCESNGLALECGNPMSAILQLSSVSIPTTVAVINIDTSCIKNSKIKLDFEFNIDTTAGVTAANLAFQVFKFCSRGYSKIPVGPQYLYSNSAVTEFTNVFTFFVNDSDTNNGKCTYIVEATLLS